MEQFVEDNIMQYHLFIFFTSFETNNTVKLHSSEHVEGHDSLNN